MDENKEQNVINENKEKNTIVENKQENQKKMRELFIQ
jgi:hypothetical protein